MFEKFDFAITKAVGTNINNPINLNKSLIIKTGFGIREDVKPSVYIKTPNQKNIKLERCLNFKSASISL